MVESNPTRRIQWTPICEDYEIEHPVEALVLNQLLFVRRACRQGECQIRDQICRADIWTQSCCLSGSTDRLGNSKSIWKAVLTSATPNSPNWMLPDGVVAWRREAAASAPSQVTRNHGSMAAVYPIFGQTDWWNMAIDPDNIYMVMVKTLGTLGTLK